VELLWNALLCIAPALVAVMLLGTPIFCASCHHFLNLVIFVILQVCGAAVGCPSVHCACLIGRHAAGHAHVLC
jgi:hypothetical protein